MTYTDVVSVVAPGRVGSAEVVHDTPSDLQIMRACFQGMPLEKRTYVRLLVNGYTMMTDARFERVTNAALLQHARGAALIAGLGIGLILEPLMKACDSVTVIEKNADVIALVADKFPHVSVVKADIFDWRPARGTKFDTIYFDIWPEFSMDEVEQGRSLKKAFRRYLAKGGWMGSWAEIAYRYRGRC